MSITDVFATGAFIWNVKRSKKIEEDRKKPLIPKRLDYFMEIGAGCDFYFSWFKLCPQIKYQLGFANLAPEHYPQGEPLNSAAISRMRSHAICIVFNFE